jgi:hypothetical protein
MKRKARSKITPPLLSSSSLPQFLAHHIARADLTHRELASKCGFRRPNIISMIKLGHTRLPLNRLAAIARVLEIDPVALFRSWMKEYYGQAWEELEPLIFSDTEDPNRP